MCKNLQETKSGQKFPGMNRPSIPLKHSLNSPAWVCFRNITPSHPGKAKARFMGWELQNILQIWKLPGFAGFWNSLSAYSLYEGMYTMAPECFPASRWGLLLSQELLMHCTFSSSGFEGEDAVPMDWKDDTELSSHVPDLVSGSKPVQYVIKYICITV